MDADLSHPPEALDRILAKLEEGADFVVGSRYVRGGTTSDDWGALRWLNSRVATLVARPLTTVRDPMAGFFALRRLTFEQGQEFNPIGYKSPWNSSSSAAVNGSSKCPSTARIAVLARVS
jgi:dolichol-phosphate mannosyltransferase